MHKLQCGGAPERAGPSKGAQYRLGRFLKGKQPTRELALDGPFRMLPSELAWRPVPPPNGPGDGDVPRSASDELVPSFEGVPRWETGSRSSRTHMMRIRGPKGRRTCSSFLFPVAGQRAVPRWRITDPGV